MDTSHLEARLAHEVVRDCLRDRLVGKVGVGVEGLEGVIGKVFEVFLDCPLDLGVVFWSQQQPGVDLPPL